jgi:L-fuculose-phosphate aldolase
LTEIIEQFSKVVAQTANLTYQKGLSPGTAGNISAKFGDKIYITPSGKCLGEVTFHDIVVIDIGGNVISGALKPSSEKLMHLEIYKSRPEITAIIHAHPPKSSVLAVTKTPLNKPFLAETLIVLGEVPVCAFALPGSQELAQAAKNHMLKNDALILANHGVLTIGKTLIEAFYKLETLEFSAEVYITSKLLGKQSLLSKENVKGLIDIHNCIQK